MTSALMKGIATFGLSAVSYGAMTARGYYRLERASAFRGCPGIVLKLHHHSS